MKHHKHTGSILLCITLICLMISPALAGELTIVPGVEHCFSAEEFSCLPEDEGVFITAVPDEEIASVFCGDRMIRAGDALPLEAMNQLTLEAHSVLPHDTSIEYYTLSDGHISAAKSLRMSILPQKNEPPEADADSFETYKNIAFSGKVKASDPEGEVLTFRLEKEPKRGTVELSSDGSFTYTPLENKVGKDSFTFVATDKSGNVSEPAKISVEIKKPTDQNVYADMDGDPDAFAAMWMKEEGLFTGASIGGHLCFSPDTPVTRGEFLVMTMKLVDAQASEETSSTGFADEQQTPVWMRSYISTALLNGMISGTVEEDRLVFHPTDVMTRAEAAVMLQNILDLPVSDSHSVFNSEQNAVPTWARSAAAALAEAGIHADAGEEPITRRDVANLLLQIQRLLNEKTMSTFYWVQ